MEATSNLWSRFARATRATSVASAGGAFAVVRSVCTFALALAMAASSFAQAATGTITGRVLSSAHLRSILKVHPAGVMDGTLEQEPSPLYLVPRQPAAPSLVVSVAADEFPQPRTAAR